MPKLAQNIVDTLHASGVRRVYGLPGDSLNGFTDALRVTDDIEWVHVRHEEAAAFAASAEAALTGELAVCAGSCGPVNLHLINGLFDAQRSRVPRARDRGAHPRPTRSAPATSRRRTRRSCSASAACTPSNVSSPDQMPRMLRIAMREAIEKRGVAVLVIPGDIALADVKAAAEEIRAYPSRVIRPAESQLVSAADALNAAKKVTILAGAGVAGAHDELIAIAEKLQAPIVHAMRGKEFVAYDNPYDVGMTGLIGVASGYHAMRECDTLLMLGTDFPYQQFFPDDATVIQVDIRGEQIGRRTQVDVGLVGGAAETISELLPRLGRDEEVVPPQGGGQALPAHPEGPR